MMPSRWRVAVLLIPACWWRAKTWPLGSGLLGPAPFVEISLSGRARAPITSRNFAAMALFQLQLPRIGRARGNHWGDALSMFVTSARSPYYFSLHASDPVAPDGGSRKDTGHTLICGPTGSGKTVFIGFPDCYVGADRESPRSSSTRIVDSRFGGAAALAGDYLPLKSGNSHRVQSRCSCRAHRQILNSSKSGCASSRVGLPAPRRSRVLCGKQPIWIKRTCMAPYRSNRPRGAFPRLVEFLDPTDPEGLGMQGSRGGANRTAADYAWVFDNPCDSVVARLSGAALVGFLT